MENVVYERDYSEELSAKEELSLSSYTNAILDRTNELGIIDAFKEKIRDAPRVILLQDKANFEYLLPRLDALAKKVRGRIHAEINYQRWDSSIDLKLPFLEFFFDSDYNLLKDIAAKTSGFNVTATEDGEVRVHVMIDYFTEVGMDAQQRREFFSAEIEKKADLKELFEQYEMEKLKLELEPITGVPGELMNEDMLWFINYASKLEPTELNALLAGPFADCVGDSMRLLERVQELRAKVDDT